MATIGVNWTCPYCGTKNRSHHTFDGVNEELRIVHCDIEEGGCDQELAIRPRLNITAEIHTLTMVAPTKHNGGKA